MKNALLYFILCFSVFDSFHANAQIWASVGNPDFSASDANYTSIAIDGSGSPYVAYEDFGNNAKATVMKYDGSSWVIIGSAGFSADTATFTTIAIDSSGTPYVAYADGGNSNKVTVMKYNGSGWVTVGAAGFSTGSASYTSLAIDRSGTPYVAYVDSSDSNKATVMKYISSGWVTVGTSGFSAGSASYTSLAIDSSGTPYVAYQDQATVIGGFPCNGATVMKYSGSSWVVVGASCFSAGRASFLSIAINTGGTPYVTYTDSYYSTEATAMKFNGSSWVSVGAPGISIPNALYTSIAIDKNGTPYVTYQDYSYSDSWIGQAMVKKYNGTIWVTVGNADFSPSQATFNSIAIDQYGSPYVAYMDVINSGKAMVMKVDSNLSLITGISNFCIWTTTFLSDSTSGGIWSSSNTAIATVSTSGMVTGIGTGYAAIFYTVSGNSAVYEISVDSLYRRPICYPNMDSICIGQTAMIYTAIMTGPDTGGQWFSTDTSIATIVTGIINRFANLTGVASGMVSIGLILTNACGIDTVYYSFLIGHCNVGVKNIIKLNPSIIIFPNPATNQLTISATDNITAVTVTNLLGQTIYTNNCNAQKVQVDIADFPTGMYFLKVNGSEVQKFVKK